MQNLLRFHGIVMSVATLLRLDTDLVRVNRAAALGLVTRLGPFGGRPLGSFSRTGTLSYSVPRKALRHLRVWIFAGMPA